MLVLKSFRKRKKNRATPKSKDVNWSIICRGVAVRGGKQPPCGHLDSEDCGESWAYRSCVFSEKIGVTGRSGFFSSSGQAGPGWGPTELACRLAACGESSGLVCHLGPCWRKQKPKTYVRGKCWSGGVLQGRGLDCASRNKSHSRLLTQPASVSTGGRLRDQEAVLRVTRTWKPRCHRG